MISVLIPQVNTNNNVIKIFLQPHFTSNGNYIQVVTTEMPLSNIKQKPELPSMSSNAPINYAPQFYELIII